MLSGWIGGSGRGQEPGVRGQAEGGRRRAGIGCGGDPVSRLYRRRPAKVVCVIPAKAHLVMPAKAGIQPWIPAYAGMTVAEAGIRGARDDGPRD